MKNDTRNRCNPKSSLVFIVVILFASAIRAQPPMPAAISIQPENAAGTDTITLTLDIRKACISEKSLPFTGQETIYMSGAAILPWQSRTAMDSGIGHPGSGHDGTPSSMTYNGDSTYSIRFKPSAYFDITGQEIKGLSLAFADFDQQRQAFDNSPFGCAGFYVPLRTSPPVMDTLSGGQTLEIAGLIVENTVMDFDTVRVVDHLHIELGVTLTILPGTYVEFEGYNAVNVLGTLIAEGTETDSIIFTTKDTDLGWQGFWFKDQADMNYSRFSFCRFSRMKTNEDWNGVINAYYFPRLTILHSVITNNEAHAINLANSGISLEQTTLSYNSKGGVSSYASNFSFLNCQVINNNSHGMYLNLSNPHIVNSIISNNEADGLVLTAADPRIFNSIIARNGTIALWMEISNPWFINTIFWENNDYMDIKDPASSIHFKKCILPSLPMEYIQRGHFPEFEDNYFDADPLFNNPPGDMGISPDALTADWTVPMNSPAVNNGAVDIEGFEVPSTDLGGNERIIYGIVDIGPYEYSHAETSLSIKDEITGDHIWMVDTVKITGDVFIINGAKVTIAPGTRVEFQGHYDMVIQGCLIANGAEDHKIRFTINDPTGFDNLDTTLGTWGGLTFNTWDNPPSVLNHCIFEFSARMTGEERRGGAVLISNHSSPHSITNCLFQYNYAEWQGGALMVYWAGPDIAGNEFRYNTSGEGGAIQTSSTSSPVIRENYIHHNHAWFFGGGIYSSGAALIIGNRISYNHATSQGGGIYCRKSKARVIANIIHNNTFGGLAVKNCDPFIASNLIVNNAADAPLGDLGKKREGSGIFIDINSDAIIVNNTICHNLSSQYKGSSVRLLSDTKFINNILWGNWDDFGNPAPISIEGAIHVDILNSIVQGGMGSIRIENLDYHGIIEGILDSLPQFLNPSEGIGMNSDGSAANWNINALSPAINNGTYDPEIFQEFLRDYENHVRNPDQIDIGAYEHQTGDIEIYSQPIDIVACDGDTAVFEVMANDTAYYQWYHNEQKIHGENLPQLVIYDVELENSGVYSCQVRNAYGERISEPSFMIVNHPPVIFIQPEKNWMKEGAPVVLEAGAEGTPPMHFQWFKDGIPIEGAEHPKLVIPNPDSDREGLYNCMIENFCGTTSSDSIQLFLAPQICIVTVDTIDYKHNLIVWEKKTNAPIAYYNVYREAAARGQYELLGRVPVDSLSVYTDTTAIPAQQSYIYKITAVDFEENESDIELCNPHKTIRLLVTLNTQTDEAWLTWEEFYGFPFGTYLIHRSEEKVNFNWVYPMTASNTSWSDIFADPNTRYYYRIAVAKEAPCVPTSAGKKAGTAPYQHSLSNLDDNKKKALGLGALTENGTLTVFPNPMQDFATVRFRNPGHEEHTLYIRDVSGKTVCTINGITSGEVRIDRNGLKSGYYLLEISGASTFHSKLIIR